MEGPGVLGGRYELRGVLGFGGMAEVRDGWDNRLNRPVAVKLLHPGMSSQAEMRDRFKVEARAAAALNHPNIVGVYDFGLDGPTPFIVMERLSGETLGDQIALGPLPQAQVHGVLRDVLAALAVAHEAGMLHRDIKPGNILLSDSGGVKVADFGIVKAPGSVRTTTGQLVGTLAYLSPDRIAGVPASVTDELYAVGVVGYEALTARKPFVQEDIAPLARAITEDDPPPLAELRPDVDARLVDVIERAMSRDPSRRFGSAEEMARALGTGVAEGRSALVAPTPSATFRQLTAYVSPPRYGPVSAPSAVVPTVVRYEPNRIRKVVGTAAVLGALAVTALALALDSTPTTVPNAPEPVGISTTALPPTVATAVPPPVVQSVAPSPIPVVESAATVREEPVGSNKDGGGGNGKGNGGNGNGHVHKKPK